MRALNSSTTQSWLPVWFLNVIFTASPFLTLIVPGSKEKFLPTTVTLTVLLVSATGGIGVSVGVGVAFGVGAVFVVSVDVEAGGVVLLVFTVVVLLHPAAISATVDTTSSSFFIFFIVFIFLELMHDL